MNRVGGVRRFRRFKMAIPGHPLPLLPSYSPASGCSCDLSNVDLSASMQSLGLLNIAEPSWAEQMLSVRRRWKQSHQSQLQMSAVPKTEGVRVV